MYTKKVFQCLYKFKESYFPPSFEIKKLLVSFLVLPYFYNGTAAYFDINDTLINKSQTAQNFCIIYLFNLRLDDHVTPFFEQLE